MIYSQETANVARDDDLAAVVRVKGTSEARSLLVGISNPDAESVWCGLRKAFELSLGFYHHD